MDQDTELTDLHKATIARNLRIIENYFGFLYAEDEAIIEVAPRSIDIEEPVKEFASEA